MRDQDLDLLAQELRRLVSEIIFRLRIRENDRAFPVGHDDPVVHRLDDRLELLPRLLAFGDIERESLAEEGERLEVGAAAGILRGLKCFDGRLVAVFRSGGTM